MQLSGRYRRNKEAEATEICYEWRTASSALDLDLQYFMIAPQQPIAMFPFKSNNAINSIKF